MAFQFYIDGQLTDQPINGMDLSTSISRDNETAGINITQDIELKWNGNNALNPGEFSGYDIIKAAFDSSTCQELLIQIYDIVSDTETIYTYRGVIKVPNVKIDYQKVIVTCKIEDDSFFAYINNNKSIEFNLNAVKTKNGQPLTPATVTNVNMHDTSNGTYPAGYDRDGIKVIDAFDFLVKTMSDNKVSFFSQTLQTEPILMLFTGDNLVNNNGNELILSFDNLYDEVKKVRNIGYYIDTTNKDNPVLRIETLDYLYSQNNFFEFTDIKELLGSVYSDDIYSVVNVGASFNPGGAASVYTFNSGTSYYGWLEEKYAPLGQCNFDNELNLVNDFAITSNAISDQLFGAVTTNLDRVFMVECYYDLIAANYQSVAYPSWVNTAFYYYNQGLNNVSKLQVQQSNYQTSLTNTQAIGTLGFRAELGQDATGITSNDSYVSPNIIFPVIFTDESSGNNYDGSGNYFNTTGQYIVSVAGSYSFTAKAFLENNYYDSKQGNLIINSSPSFPAGTYSVFYQQGARVALIIEAYTDNTLTTLIGSQVNIVDKLLDGLWSVTVNFSSILPLNAAVVVRFVGSTSLYVTGNLTNSNGQNVGPLPLTNMGELDSQSGWSLSFAFPNGGFPQPAQVTIFEKESFFECNGTPEGGLIFGFSDPSIYKNKLFEFEYDINVSDWELFKANPTGLIKFEKDNVVRYGWIDEIKHNDWTGMTNIRLISNNASTS